MFDNRKIKTDKQIVGQKGEDLATRFLVKKGFKILERNYWKPWGEIDIVARKGENLHFVEVKTVSVKNSAWLARDNYEPEDNIHPWKIKRLSRTIETYLLEKDNEDIDWQVDAVAVYLGDRGELLKIDHLEDIF